MLGAASLKCWTISPVNRLYRLISPQGIFQVPKSFVSLSTAEDNTRSNSWSLAAFAASRDFHSSAQYTARVVGIDFTDHRVSHALSIPIGSSSFFFRGLDEATPSQAFTKAGIRS